MHFCNHMHRYYLSFVLINSWIILIRALLVYILTISLISINKLANALLLSFSHCNQGLYYTNIAFVWGRYKDILTWKKYIDWGRSPRSIYFFGSIYPVLTSYKGYVCYIINFRPYLYHNRHLILLEFYRYYIVYLTITKY